MINQNFFGVDSMVGKPAATSAAIAGYLGVSAFPGKTN
jgi:hypothetical protein